MPSRALRLSRVGACCDIEILWGSSDQEIPNASSDKVAFVPTPLKT